MKSQQVVLISILGFALLCLAGLWWLKAETPAPAPERGEPVPAVTPPARPPPPPAVRPAPVQKPAPRPAPSTAPLQPPRLPRADEKAIAPRMTPLPPNWDVKRLHFAHDAPTALEAIQPLVAECFTDNAGPLRPGAQAVLQFGVDPQGDFEGTSVVSSTVQGPYFQACLEDALHDAKTTEGEREPSKYLFKFEPDGGTSVERAP
jgi:hypothetical protein